MGQAENALGCVRRADALLGGAPGLPLSQAWRATTELLAGDPTRARATVARLEEAAKTSFVDPAAIAGLHYALGDVDATFATLERGFTLRSPLMASLLTMRSFMWRDIADDPRYASLIERMGFPR